MDMMKKYKFLFICLFLAVSVSLVYLQMIHHDFISFDDNDYIYDNTRVIQGITKDNLIWAFGLKDHENTYWHPLTWLSHMLDCELFGLDSGLHHLTSMMLHLLNSIVLFLVLYKMTGAPWKSGVVASLFALHPVNVDSVAWLAERKNLLSTLFWMLTIYTYTVYVNKQRTIFYLLALFTFILGLLSKPMLVTLPFVLIIIDFWPLKRIRLKDAPEFSRGEYGIISQIAEQKTRITKVILEKIPFMLLSLASIYISLYSFDSITSGITGTLSPMLVRAANALVSYVKYISLLIFPHDLDFFYPYPQYVPLGSMVFSGIVLAVLTLGAFSKIKRSPYLVVGWLWFLGTLFPVMGLVQRGLWPAYAERWAYIPFIGMFIVLVWGFSDLTARLQRRRPLRVAAASSVLLTLMALSWMQAGYWKDSATLYKHSLEVNPDNYVALVNMGTALAYENRNDEAIEYFQKSLAANPNLAISHYNLGDVLRTLGRIDDAQDHYARAISLKPDYFMAYAKLGNILWEQEKAEEAIELLTKALDLNPGYRAVSNNLGEVLAKSGRKKEAIEHYTRTVSIDPENAVAYNNLAYLLMEKGESENAVRYYYEALKIDPDYAKAHVNLASLLQSMGKTRESMSHFREAVRADPDNENGHINLGILYSRQGDEGKAIRHLRETIRIRPDNLQAHYLIAACYNRTGNLEDALHHARKVSSSSDDFPEAQELLDAILSRKQSLEGRIADLEKNLVMSPDDSDLLLKLAVMNRMLQQFDKSLSYLHRLEDLRPGDPDVLYNIACMYAMKNDVEKALTYLERALETGFDDLSLVKSDLDLENIRGSDSYHRLISGH